MTEIVSDEEHIFSVIKTTSNSNNKRLKNVTIKKPIIVGNTATKIVERNSNTPLEHTHNWKIFILSPTVDGQKDLSFIKKITFKLHDSYQPSIRTVEYDPEKPFLIEETGWGEFEISMKIYFQEGSQEKFLQVYHPLRLHSFYLVLNESSSEYDKKLAIAKEGENLYIDQSQGLVKSLYYDEIVFHEPYADFFVNWLMKSSSLLNKHEGDIKVDENGIISYPYSEEVELNELERLENALMNAEGILKNLRVKYMEKQQSS
ncbi:hypothetical protein QEN19_004281 [Hanseniaspora menglaensis]